MASAAVVQDRKALENPAPTLETDAVGAAVCSELPLIDPKDLTLLNEKSIGSGSEAEVYLYEWRGQQVAVKKRKKSANWSKQYRESSCLEQLQHENIIAIHGYSLLPERGLVLEYAAGGTLKEVLEKHYTSMTEDVQVVWATQVARGVKYLQEHQSSFVHRDLKSNNILIMEAIHSSDDLTKKTLKICDFGFVAKNCEYTRASIDGSDAVPWAAPETKHPDQRKVSKKSDVWSFGVVLHEIAYRRVPMITDTVDYTAEEGLFKSLVEGCLKHIHTHRLDMQTVCSYLESILSPTQPRDTFQDFARKNAIITFRANEAFLDKIPEKFLQDCNETGELDLSQNNNIVLDGNLGRFKNLRKLKLEACGLSSVPSDISKLTQLEELDLSRNNFAAGLQPSFSELQRLKKLVLNGCHLTSVPEWFGLLKALEYVALSHNKFSAGLNPAIGQLQQLKMLALQACGLRSVPEWFNGLNQLHTLVLADNDLKDFPTCLNHLNCLQELDLSNNETLYVDHRNHIRRLPGNFDFAGLCRLNLKGNPVTEPPEEIWNQGPDAIRSFMQEGGTDRGEQFLCCVVDTCTGNICVDIARASSVTTESDRTQVRQLLQSVINKVLGHTMIGNDVRGLTFSQYLMEVYLPIRGLVMIVFDLTKAVEERRQSIEKWLLAAVSKSGKIRIVIVGRHADEISTSERLTLEEETSALSKEILQVAFKKVSSDIADVESFSNDAVKPEKLNKLRVLQSNIEIARGTMRFVTMSRSVPDDDLFRLHNIVVEMKQSPNLFPIHWCDAMSKISKLNPSGFYVEISEIRKIAKDHFTEEDDKSLTTILRYLADTSQIIWVENHPYLKNLIFHLPLEIIDACKKLLLHDYKILGELHEEDRKAYEKGIVRESLLQKVLDEQRKVSSDCSQEELRQSALDFQVAVDFMEHFNLIKIVPTRGSERKFTIPCKLPAYEPELVKSSKKTAATISQNRIKVRLSFRGSMCRLSFFETSLGAMLAVAVRLSLHGSHPWKGGLIVFHDGVTFLAKLNEKKGCITLTAWCKPPAQSPWTVLQPMLQCLSELAVTWHGPPPMCSVACPHCVGRRQPREIQLRVGEFVADLRQLADLTEQDVAVTLLCPVCRQFIDRRRCLPPTTQGGALVAGATQGTSTISMPSRELDDMDAKQIWEQFRRNYSCLIVRLTIGEVGCVTSRLYSQRMLLYSELEIVRMKQKTTIEAAKTLIDIVMKRNTKELYSAFLEMLRLIGRHDLVAVLTTLRQ